MLNNNCGHRIIYSKTAETRQAIEPDSVPSPLVHMITLAQFHGNSSFLVIAPGQRIFIHNKGPQEVSIAEGCMLVGFYRGKWWQRKEQEPTAEDVLFHVRDGDDKVVCNNAFKPIKEVVAQKRKQSPVEAAVSYHNLKDAPRPNDPGFFTLDLKHHMYFKVSDLPVQVKEEQGVPSAAVAKVIQQSHAASALPVACWETAISTVAWVVKWVPGKGLQPVRPIVVATQAVKVPANKAIELKRNT